MSDYYFDLGVDKRIYVAGHAGLVGSAIWRLLKDQGFQDLIGHRSNELDLRDRASVMNFFREQQPQVVVLAAARVGGILANATYPADFFSDNIQIQTNVVDASHEVGVERLLFLGSSCIYPKFADQPIKEESLLTGLLEPTNDAYAIAKIAGILHVDSMRRQHGHHWISAMPTNLYGPGDNFDLQGSHVLPAMIRKFHEAKITNAPAVTLWGTGAPLREFLHADDLAAAALHLLRYYDQPGPINVGVGEDIRIKNLAVIVAGVVGFTGALEWDASKPDGTPRKLLDVSRLTSLGWKASIELTEGIRSTYDWYRKSGDS